MSIINFIVWIVVGGILGWIAGLIMHESNGPLLNVIVGIVGAFLAGLIITPLVGVSTINQGNFSIVGLLLSLGGAIVLLAIVNLIRRGTVR